MGNKSSTFRETTQLNKKNLSSSSYPQQNPTMFGKVLDKNCPYCGNNPVPHWFFWFNESLNILLTPIRQKILYNRLTRFFKTRKLDGKLGLFFLRLGEALKIITRQKNMEQCKVRRAQVLWEEAGNRGIEMAELLLFGWPIDVYVGTKGQGTRDKGQEKQIVFSGLPRPSGYSNNWLDLMDDKWLFKKVMMQHGLPVPEGRSVPSFEQAKKVFNHIQQQQKNNQNVGLIGSQNSPTFRPSDLPTPVIVKPRAGSRGRHSTTFVLSESDLKQAFKIAKQLCYWVMVEEQLFGPVYRATLINFELCGVLRGDPPQVIGDGTHSIVDLIALKNNQPHPGVKDIVVDENVIRFLGRELNLVSSSSSARDPLPSDNQQLSDSSSRALLRIGMTLDDEILNYIPPPGYVINFSEKIGVNYGGSSSEDFEICHPDNKELFVKAAKVLGDPIVGFDFIIPDITKSYKQQKCGFIEVNSLPFINLHHDPLLGKPRNVAAKVWDLVGW